MKKNRIVAALLCASVSLATSAAFAQQMHGGPDDGHGGPGQQHANNQHANNQPDQRHDDRHDMGRPPAHAENGPDHHPDWHKGDRLSSEYHDRQYVVDDWRGYGLRQPPRGYHWVGVGGDYLLVAAASGVIAQIVLAR
jgi:Ni/Co efflux regulator RcnB